jgi:hypothetical protein
MSKNKIQNLSKQLISINPNIITIYEYYKNTTKPPLLSNYLLHNISYNLLNIYNSMTSINMSVAYELIEHMINNIIISEKMVSKIDIHQFKKLASAPNIDVDIEHMDKNNTNDINDIDANAYNLPTGSEIIDDNIDNEIEDKEDADDDEFQEGQFSYNDIDMDMDEEENMEMNVMEF